MFVALGVTLLFGTLGVAFGAGWWWTALSAIIGFFVGGWFAGRTIGFLDSTVAAAHGLLVWAVGIVLFLLASLAFGLAGINTVANTLHSLGISNLFGYGNYAAPSAAAAASTASTSGWLGFFGILLPLIAAIAGAIVGNNARHVEPASR
jgi:hypothetical protein